MDFKNGLAVLAVRQADVDAAVETARAQQCRVKHVSSVSSCQDYNVLPLFEAVHFDQDLVKGLLTFVVPTAHTGTATAADGVDFINKNNARRILFGLGEQVADAGSANADE